MQLWADTRARSMAGHRAGSRRVLAGVAVLTLLAMLWPQPPARAAITEGFSDTLVFGGLTLPTSLAFAPDGRIFVGEKSGIIKVFDGLGDTTPEVFADLTANVHDYVDRGFVGLAVNPNFPADPYVHVLYTHDGPIGSTAPVYGDECPPDGKYCTAGGRLSRLRVAGNRMAAEEVLIEDWCTNYRAHSVGGLVFGPDGALYASAGDGGGVVDHGQLGNPANPCGDPPDEGGNVRAQDLYTRGPNDPVGLGGSIIRVDPKTGAPWPGNPLAADADVNAKRIMAYGLRMPFRFTVRPGTSELWVGDVGRNIREELNRVPAPQPGTVPNFGWPCYEGPERHGDMEDVGLALCNELYANPQAVTAPVLSYAHSQKLVGGEECPADSAGSIAGLAFYQGTAYPEPYRGALFVGDYARSCLWTMRPGADGSLDPTTIATFSSDIGAIVDLQSGPGGDLFYVDIVRGEVRRIVYGSSGAPAPPGGSGPVPSATISAPATSTRWAVGDRIDFAGSATDASGAPLPDSALTWSLQLQHCETPESCHAHPLQTFQGVATGSFTAPEHGYPSYIDVRLTATDPAGGQTDTETLRLEPRTLQLSFETDPSGLQVDVDGVTQVTPFARTAVVGSDVAVSAPSPQQLAGASHEFVSWSNGGARSQVLAAPAEPTTYRADFTGASGAGAVERLAGDGRVETAVSVSEATFAPGIEVAYVARADGFADALAGGPAAARRGGPVLLVSSDGVPPATMAELRRLRPQRIAVLGGVNAISDAVKATLEGQAPVERIAGSDRYATAAEVSRMHFSSGAPVAYVATGETFPDALAGGAAAAAEGGPLLLVTRDGVPSATAAELQRLRPQRIVLLGGETAVSGSAELALRGFGGVERRSGDDRYATAAAVSAGVFRAGVGTVYVATGRDFPRRAVRGSRGRGGPGAAAARGARPGARGRGGRTGPPRAPADRRARRCQRGERRGADRPGGAARLVLETRRFRGGARSADGRPGSRVSWRPVSAGNASS